LHAIVNGKRNSKAAEAEKKGRPASLPFLESRLEPIVSGLRFRAYFACADSATQFIPRCCVFAFRRLIGSARLGLRPCRLWPGGFGRLRFKNLLHSLGLASVLLLRLACADAEELAPVRALLSLSYAEHFRPINMSRSSLALNPEINPVVIERYNKGIAVNINLAIYRLGKFHENTP
jgi:hypothetical protein